MKKVLALLISAMMFCMFVPMSYADSVSNPNHGEMSILNTEDEPFLVRGDNAIGLYNDIWKVVYRGNGSAVNLTVHNSTGFWFSVRMYDYGGTKVWEEQFSLAPYASRIYYVGSNVARVEMKGATIGLGVVYVSATPA